MKISEHWLRDWVNPTVSGEQLAEQLTMAGLEVDSVEPAAESFNDVVIGKVVQLEQHPNADRLRVATVDVGQSEHLQIVCGAPNVRQDMMVATALVGAKLPGDFKIKSRRMYILAQILNIVIPLLILIF